MALSSENSEQGMLLVQRQEQTLKRKSWPSVQVPQRNLRGNR